VKRTLVSGFGLLVCIPVFLTGCPWGAAPSVRTALGVCVGPVASQNAARTVDHRDYVHEILAHAGLCYTEVSPGRLERELDGLRVLVTVGEHDPSASLAAALANWVGAGGVWIGVGGVWGLEELFGVQVEPPGYSGPFSGQTSTLGEGYLRPDAPGHPMFGHVSIPMHFFNGVPVRPTDATVLASVLDAHQGETPRAAVVERYVGAGRCVLIAPDVTGTVVLVQQGLAVTRDGIPAPDGTAPLRDGVLKTDDGLVLDWSFDREPVAGVAGYSAFLQPIADQWRELLLRAILEAAEGQGIALPILWLYPRNLPALAHMSHDTDGNDAGKARRLLSELTKAGIASTWCVILPGYRCGTIEAIARAGHELGMHYDAMSPGCPWGRSAFWFQGGWLTCLFGGRPIVTNKNHYLRWEGDTEFFHWCADLGIEIDQSKGPSKTGDAGFPFGTCHPYFPVDPDGDRINVLELALHSQDLGVFAPPELLEPLLTAVVRHHGILHLLFHPGHIDKPGQAEILHSSVRAALEQGLEWWTSEAINEWERARRQAHWTDFQESGSVARVTLNAPTTLTGATILWLAPGAQSLYLDGEEQPAPVVERWGFLFSAGTVDLAAGERCVAEIVF